MNRKGFTLTELIAAITLLVIIIIIIAPKILSSFNSKTEELSKQKQELIFNAIDNYMDVRKNEYPRDIGKSYCISLNNLKQEEVIGVDIADVMQTYTYVSVKVGLNHTNSYSLFETQADCQLAIGSNVTVTPEITPVVATGATKVDAQAGETHKGIVYLDPTDLTKTCNASNSTSTTETKVGCMKWYIFDDSGDNYTMILDHNTTTRIKWNDSNSNVAYELSNLKAVVDDLVTTSGWEVTPRLITATEINTIVGGVATWNVNDYNSWFYLEGASTKNQTKPTYNVSNRSSYDWSYNNLYNCKSDSIDYGCNIEDNNSYTGYGTAGDGNTLGYWTSTPGGTNRVWYIDRRGILNPSPANDTPIGVRPVITLSKSIFES